MEKIAAYLQGHVLGEVSTRLQLRQMMSRDGSVLEMIPQVVIYPEVTNDIRKVARFSWQLAEKGHAMPITIRGAGTDSTGAAIGKGISLVQARHMNHIFELDPKQKLVRVQPGVSLKNLNDALGLQGLGIPGMSNPESIGTVGGALGNNSMSILSGKYGNAADAIDKMEVVLANGDVIQTGRISKRELNRKKGIQGFEGDLYRGIDALIDDNKELIAEKLDADSYDSAGYASIARVKRKDGSFDLTPLIVGSQGTLGIVAEVILKCQYVSSHQAVSVLTFELADTARDMLDELRKLNPAFFEYYDMSYFDEAIARGRNYSFLGDASVACVIVIGFDDFSARTRHKNNKRVAKIAKKYQVGITQADGEEAVELLAIRNVRSLASLLDKKDLAQVPVANGFYVPDERLEDFMMGLAALGKKMGRTLPFYGWPHMGIYFVEPEFNMAKVGDKQKIFKIIDGISQLVANHGGHFIAMGGEGRLKTLSTWSQLDQDIRELYEAVRKIFDPYSTLNPGVKQVIELRSLTSSLRDDYTPPEFL